MHLHILAVAIGLALSLAGCERPPASASPPTPAQSQAAASAPRTPDRTAPGRRWLDDGRPQTGLPRLKLYLGARELNAELALTTDAIQKGMMWRTNVAETDAMLFVFGRAHRTAFWMKNVPMHIDVAYLDPEGVILEIHRLERQNTTPVEAKSPNVHYALETAEGWFQRNGIGVGTAVRSDRGSLQETFFRGGSSPKASR